MTKPQTDLEELKELGEIARSNRERLDVRPEVVVGGVTKLTPEDITARKRRNMWLALSIGAFIVLVFAITMVQLRAGLVAGAQ